MPKPVSFPFPIRAQLPPNSAFGKRPLYNDFHSGVDFNSTTGANLGSPVRAAGAGRVVESYDGNDPRDGVDTNWAKLRGTMVRIDHGDGWWTRYHMLNPNTNIPEGSIVKAGDVIGHVGNSGSSGTGAHLHFELWRNGVAINPVGQLTYNPGAFLATTDSKPFENSNKKDIIMRYFYAPGRGGMVTTESAGFFTPTTPEEGVALSKYFDGVDVTDREWDVLRQAAVNRMVATTNATAAAIPIAPEPPTPDAIATAVWEATVDRGELITTKQELADAKTWVLSNSSALKTVNTKLDKLLPPPAK